MNRRRFLQSGTLLGAGLVAGALRGPSAFAAPDTGDQPGKGLRAVAGRRATPKLSLSLAAYSFRAELQSGAMTLEDFVDFCALHDLEGTELTSYYFKDTSPTYLAELRRRAYVNGLTISGTPVGNDFCVPAGPQRDKELAHVRTWIDHVALLGSQTIRVFAGRVPRESRREEAQERCIDGLKEVAKYAGERGVLLALENHGGITATADQLLHLVRAVDSPWLGVNLDTGNFHTPDPYGDMEKAAPYAVAAQVKVEIQGRPADLDRIIGILNKANYRGFVALEYEASEPALEAVPVHLKRLRAAMGSHG